MLHPSSLRRLFHRIAIWQRGAERAPNKPLVLLYALRRLQRGDLGPFRFAAIEVDLRGLLQRYGPPRATLHPEYPFLRLTHDGIWQLIIDGGGTSNVVSQQPSLQELRERFSAGFTSEVVAVLISRPRIIFFIALDLLQRHFPGSLHEEILDAGD